MRDYLGISLRGAPYFRALLRSVEARFYQGIDFPSPTLDLGCGDGHFSDLTFESAPEVGMDPWWDAIREAQERQAYRDLVCASGAALPFRSRSFNSGLSNSVLEHIPEVEPVLGEISRVLQPGSPFVFSVPNHRFLEELSIAGFFDRLGWKGIADRYRAFFDRISRHYHCDPPSLWEERLSRVGFELVEWWHYFSPGALHALEWGHYFGLPSLVSKKLTGRWILAPTSWNLGLTRLLIEKHYQGDARGPAGTYTFYITRRL